MQVGLRYLWCLLRLEAMLLALKQAMEHSVTWLCCSSAAGAEEMMQLQLVKVPCFQLHSFAEAALDAS